MRLMICSVTMLARRAGLSIRNGAAVGCGGRPERGEEPGCLALVKRATVGIPFVVAPAGADSEVG